MPRRRRDGTGFQAVLPLETWPDKARQAGYLAAQRGLPESACPYGVRTSMVDAWLSGHREALSKSSKALPSA